MPVKRFEGSCKLEPARQGELHQGRRVCRGCCRASLHTGIRTAVASLGCLAGCASIEHSEKPARWSSSLLSQCEEIRGGLPSDEGLGLLNPAKLFARSGRSVGSSGLFQAVSFMGHLPCIHSNLFVVSRALASRVRNALSTLPVISELDFMLLLFF